MDGKKIKYYRLKKGLTSEDLAREIGCSKAAISLYESNEREPSEEMCKKIAEVLGVSWINFLPDNTNKVEFNHISFRKKQNASKKDIEILQCDIEKLCCDRISVMSMLGLIHEKRFKPKKLSYKNSIHDNAKTIREALGVPLFGPIYSITSILENAGIIVLTFECPEEIDGLNGLANDIPYIFFNSKNRTIERQRSTIVHETCHLFFNNNEEDISEKESEKYITSLTGHVLVPDEDLYREFGRTNRNLTIYIRDSFAKQYKVAPSCLVTRLYESGIITKMYYQNFFIFLNRTGGRKNEKTFLNEKSDSERPTIFEYQVYRALSDELITNSRAAEYLHVPLYEVMQKARV